MHSEIMCSPIRFECLNLIVIPESDLYVNALLAVLPLQLLSYHMSVMRGFDPDFPRNLSMILSVRLVNQHVC